MCFPPEISVPALPAFARVRDWRGEERGSKQWKPSCVLLEGVEKWSAPDASSAQNSSLNASCDRAVVASRNHVDDAAEICAAGIKLPLQSPAVLIYEDNETAFDPSEHSLTPARALERRGSLPLGSGGVIYEPLEVASAVPQQLHRTNEETGFAAWQEQQMFLNADLYMKDEVSIFDGVEIEGSLQQTELELPVPKFDDTPVAVYSDLEKLEAEFLEGGKGPRGSPLQQPVASETPELENLGSFSAWFDYITKNDAEAEEPSVIKESSTAASFEEDTKPVKKAPKQTKGGKKQKTAPAVNNNEGTVEADTDDETEPVLIDEKRKRRMLSNRASAQRSRQRRQDRLDQLEVLTAQLRVENASLLRKSNLALQLARKLEGEKKRLLEKAESLTKELNEAQKLLPATAKLHEECHSSPNNTGTDISEIAGDAELSLAVVKPKPAKLQEEDDEKKPLRSAGSGSYVTVDDQMDTSGDTDMREDTDMTADCNNNSNNSEGAKSRKQTFQVSEDEDATTNRLKMTGIGSPVSCKTDGNNDAQALPLLLAIDSKYLFKELCDLFESDGFGNPCNNDAASDDAADDDEDILNTMDQNWLESFAECLNA